MKPLNKHALTLKQSGIRSATVRCVELNGINLGQGTCDLPVQDVAKQAACNAINNDRNTYGEYRGNRKLRNLLAEKIARFNHVSVDPMTELLISHGATGAYVSAIRALFNAGDELVLFEPFYGYHKSVAELFGVGVKTVSLNLKDLSFDIDELKAAISEKTKAILICTPNNPTGKVFTKAELEAIGEVVIANDLYVLTDEMYEHFTYPGFEHTSFASLSPEHFKRTVTLSGFSKVFNVTGWRMGFAYGPEELMQRIALVQDLFYICPATPLQEGIIAALQMPESYYEELDKDFLEKRDLVCTALREMGFEFTTPQGAYYILATATNEQFLQLNNLAADLLEETGVAAVNGEAFYCAANKHKGSKQLRFCFAQNTQKLAQAMDKLKRWLV
jgi:aminotransferase